MEAIRKQASRLREQVAKQQQAVLKQFSVRFRHDSALHDQSEQQCHQKLRLLYASTRAAKHLQKNIAKGVEAFISVGSKQLEILRKLGQDCCEYGEQSQTSGYALARASNYFGDTLKLIEKEMESMLRLLGEQVYEPLRVMVISAPLEDARHLTYRYESIRQDAEAQTAEVLKRQMRSKDIANADNAAKLQNAELKLLELRRAASALGREATDAMLSVEAQQQEVTFQRLLAMIDAEISFHQSVTMLLKKLHGQMVQLKQQAEFPSKTSNEAKLHPPELNVDTIAPTSDVDPRSSQSFVSPENGQNANNVKKTNQYVESPENINEQNVDGKVDYVRDVHANDQHGAFYVAEVIHSFDAQTDGELSLSVGDYVVVRQVAANGWSEGESMGKAGWFPSAYIERREKAPASKVIGLLSC
ncbi:hypothetical protein HPP92_013974 [Vanilla planifolia]|uniref:SH3 domain-containing protein n=1 Tax=Vanilla planifolia TaxID=51239 RepID=A0A835QTI3_VANPL|nr:hypothetical protein HPP92_013974 [Vanilla planifolia]